MGDLLSNYALWTGFAALLSPLAAIIVGFFLINSWQGVLLSCAPGVVTSLSWIVIVIAKWDATLPAAYTDLALGVFLALLPAVCGILAANAAALGWMLRRHFLPHAVE